MAVQAASPLAFITGGDGGGPSNPTLTPEAYERRQQLAMALMKEGGNYSPIQSPWQGVARVADAISGTLQSHWADQDNAAADKASADRFASLYDPSGGGGASPAPGFGAGGAPAPGSADGGATAPSGVAPGVAQYQPIIDQTQQKYGLPAGYLPQLITVESGGKNDAVSPTGAKGLTQFTSGTAKAYGLADPFNPAANIDAAGRLAADNAKYLTSALGRPPTAGELYLAHQQGAGAAAQLLAHPDDPATQWAPHSNLAVNGYKPGMTAGQFASKWTSRFGTDVANANPPSNPQAVASNDPNFVPPQTVQTQQQTAIPLPPMDPRGTPAQQMAAQGPGASTPGMADPIQPGAVPPGWDSQPLQPLPAGAAQALQQTPPMPGVDNVVQGAMPDAQAIPLQAALQAKAAQMQGGAPQGAQIPPNGPVTAMQPGGQPTFAPGSLTGAQAEQLANQGIRVPMSAIAPPGAPPIPAVNPHPALTQRVDAADTAGNASPAPLNQSASNGPVSAPQPQQPMPQPVPIAPPPPVAAIIAQNAAKGAPAVAQALGPSAGAPAPQANLTPGGQQVAQALNPQTPQMDPRKLAAVMADPRIPDSAKSMLLQRLKPPEYSYQTLPDGTILRMDPRGGAPVPVYQAPVKPLPKHFETVNGRVIASDETTGASSDVTPANLPPGARPLTDAEKQQFGIPPNMAVAMGADGKPFAIGGSQNNVNVNTAEETAENKKRGEINATNLAAAQQEGFTAKDDLGTINDLRATVSSIPTGFTTAVQAAASNYGIKLGPNASAIEYASSLIDKLTPQQRNGMPGAASDRDVAMFKNALPKMMNTPDGNAIILDTMQGMAEQKVARGKIANDYMTGQIDAKTAYQRMGDLPSPLLGFQQYLKAHPQGGAPQAPAAPQPSAPAQQGTSAPTAAAPPAGHPTARQAPNGKWYEPNPAYKTDPTTNQWFEVVP